MSEFSQSIEQLTLTVEKMVEKYSAIKQEVSHTESENAELKVQLSIQQNEIEELKEKNRILRIVGNNADGDNKEIKLKINEIIREVDKCIAQLNQ